MEHRDLATILRNDIACTNYVFPATLSDTCHSADGRKTILSVNRSDRKLSHQPRLYCGVFRHAE